MPEQLKATKHQTPRHVEPSKDVALNKYASYLESVDTTPTKPAHKHKRYSRIANKAVYDANFEHIFGKRPCKGRA